MKKRLRQAPVTPVGFWHSLWLQLRHFDPTAMHPGIAVRNSIGVLLSLAITARYGTKVEAMVAGLGALTVSFCDGRDPYRPRFRRMLQASVGCGLAVVLGSLVGGYAPARIFTAGLCAFAAGMLVALGPAAADLGVFSLVSLIIFLAVPAPLAQALHWGSLALGGGAVQAVLAVLFWPLDRHQPERREIAALYRALAQFASRAPRSRLTPAAAQAITQAQTAFATFEETAETSRFRSLLNQAERIRLRLFWLWRVRKRSPNASALLDEFRGACAETLEMVARAVATRGGTVDNATLAHLDDLVRRADDETSALLSGLSGQLRAAADLAGGGRFTALPTTQRADGRSRRWVMLRANLTPQSAAFRHAVRLAICVTIGEVAPAEWHLHRAYWWPMTAAMVLKPEFSLTAARGVLRVSGTLLGLVIATVIYHRCAPGFAGELLLATLFTFGVRYFGVANYGVQAIGVSGLVVTLLAISGVAPQEVVGPRALNTLLGGALAIAVYHLWPTWSGPQVVRTLALTLRAYGSYVEAVCGTRAPEAERDRLRLAARVARSNFDLACAQFRGEPRTRLSQRSWVAAIQAAGNRFAHALLAIEAAGIPEWESAAADAFRDFHRDASRTLQGLAQVLESEDVTPSFPDLRRDFEALRAAGVPLAFEREADRLTNSLNTLREKVLLQARGRV